MTTEARLGPALRGLRKRNHWTLADVAGKTGLSISTLSKAERNQLSLTYDKLVQLAEGLGVDITTFFDADSGEHAENAGPGRRSVNRRDGGQVIDTANYHHVYLSTDLLRKKFVPLIADLQARSLEQFGDLVRHAGEEFTYVVEGTVEVHTEHYAPAILEAGESIYFDSGMAHAYIARGPGRCRVLSICSAPEAALKEAVSRHLGRTLSSSPAAHQPRRGRPLLAKSRRARR